MYNTSRAASIVANSAGKLLSLDRSIFSHIIHVAALRKQIIIKEAIEKVEILKEISKDHMLLCVYLGTILSTFSSRRKSEKGSMLLKREKRGINSLLFLRENCRRRKSRKIKYQLFGNIARETILDKWP